MQKLMNFVVRFYWQHFQFQTSNKYFSNLLSFCSSWFTSFIRRLNSLGNRFPRRALPIQVDRLFRAVFTPTLMETASLTARTLHRMQHQQKLFRHQLWDQQPPPLQCLKSKTTLENMFMTTRVHTRETKKHLMSTTNFTKLFQNGNAVNSSGFA